MGNSINLQKELAAVGPVSNIFVTVALQLRRVAFCLVLAAMVAFAAPAQADVAYTPAPAGGTGSGGTSGTTTGGAGSTVGSIIRTLPGAQAAWHSCYKECRRQPGCNMDFCASHCEGSVAARAADASMVSEMMSYNVLGAYAANCIGDLRDFVNQVRTAMLTAQDAGLSVMQRAAVLIVDRILDAIINQILTNLTNQICSVSNQLLYSAQSFVSNALCMPQGSLGNLFDANINLNLGQLSCDGFAIDMLTGDVNGSPIRGVNSGNLNVYTGGYSAGTNPAPTPIDNVTVPTMPTPSPTPPGSLTGAPSGTPGE